MPGDDKGDHFPRFSATSHRSQSNMNLPIALLLWSALVPYVISNIIVTVIPDAVIPLTSPSIHSLTNSWPFEPAQLASQHPNVMTTSLTSEHPPQSSTSRSRTPHKKSGYTGRKISPAASQPSSPKRVHTSSSSMLSHHATGSVTLKTPHQRATDAPCMSTRQSICATATSFSKATSSVPTLTRTTSEPNVSAPTGGFGTSSAMRNDESLAFIALVLAFSIFVFV